MIASLCAIGAVAGLASRPRARSSNGRDCAEVSNDPSRLGTFGSARLCWWEEAWDVFAGHSPEGAGAGTFEIARKRYRSDARSVVEPHSVPLQHLSDGGVAGLALFVALIGAAAAVCIGALRRLGAPERAAGRARGPAGRLPRACARRLQLELPRGHGADDGGARRPRRSRSSARLVSTPPVARRRGGHRRRDGLRLLLVPAACRPDGAQLDARRRRERPRARARSRAVGSLLQPARGGTPLRARGPGGRGARLAGRGGAPLHPGGRAPAREPGGRGTRPGSSSSRRRTSALRTAT